MSEEKEFFRRSKLSIGEVYPVIKDSHGNIIDGYHRKASDPLWREEVREDIKTPAQLWLARIIANTRRDVSMEERAEQLTHLAEELVKEGEAKDRIVSIIAESTGFSERYIRMLLPEDYKRSYEKSEIISELEEPSIVSKETEGSEPSREPLGVELSKAEEQDLTSKSEVEAAEPAVEERPKEASQISEEMKDWLEDRFSKYAFLLNRNEPSLTYVFSRNFDLTEEQADKIFTKYRDDRRRAQSSGEPKPREERAVQVEVKKPLDTWETRKAQMSPVVSRMEDEVADDLRRLGETVETQREYCVLSTKPDIDIPQRNLCIYLDGEVHEGREDRDEQLRGLLVKRYGRKVVSIKYKSYSSAEKERVMNELKQILKEEA